MPSTLEAEDFNKNASDNFCRAKKRKESISEMAPVIRAINDVLFSRAYYRMAILIQKSF